MHPRQVAYTELRSILMLPMGLRLFSNEATHQYDCIKVSTVCLDDAHRGAMIPGSIEPETGFETMVFLKETSFFSLYRRHYMTKEDAIAGHNEIISDLKSGKLQLSIEVSNYRVFDSSDAP